MIYAIILIVLMSMDFGISLAKHGEPRNYEYNAFLNIADKAIVIFLLYMSGFFEVFK